MNADFESAPQHPQRQRTRVPAWVRRWLWRFVLAAVGLLFIDLVWAVFDPSHTARVADMLLGYLVRGAASIIPGVNL